MNHLISARQPDLEIVNKKEDLPNSGLCRPGRRQNKIKKAKIPRPCERTEKIWDMKVTVIPNVIGVLGPITKGLERVPEELEIRRQVETI